MSTTTTVKWYGDEFQDKLAIHLEEALKDSAVAIELQAKELCPVRTGALQESIDNKVEGLVADIGSDIPYARYVEMGTRRKQAQPFLRPALYETDIEQYFANII